MIREDRTEEGKDENGLPEISGSEQKYVEQSALFYRIL